MHTTTNQQSTTARHWDRIYEADPGSTGSWFQSNPEISMRLIERAGTRPGHSVVDIGGGESRLVDRLLERGFDDLTVLDVSSTALRTTRTRLATAASTVDWRVRDVRTWQPHRRYDVWHDRAVFHFLTDESDRETYLSVLHAALRPGGHVVLGTFAADGPERCSGLPVTRYSAEELAARFDDRFRVISTEREEHHTPAGTVQPFSWIVLRDEEQRTRE